MSAPARERILREALPAPAYAPSPEEGPAKPAPGTRALHARAQRPALLAVLALLRPRQWMKNGLLVAAAGAAGALGRDDVPYRVAFACVAFCLLASGIYAINDVRDAAEDRRHPRKRVRPVAAGEIEPGSALLLGVGLIVAGLLLCCLLSFLLALVGAAYIALTLSYTLVWRHLPILDVLAISGGFVLRGVAGGVAAPVTLSRWFMLVISAAAVFVAAAKRHSELARTQASGAPRRRVLELYTPRLLGAIMWSGVGVAIFAYAAWAFELPLAGGLPWRPLTILPFALCLLRYFGLVRAGAAEAPEEVLLADRPLQAAACLWLVLFAVGIHAAG